MEHAIATRPKPGERVCGDRALAQPLENGMLCAVADGLGHGPEAGMAAQIACDYVAAHPDWPLDELIRGCDQKLAGTRGAALTILRLRDGELWHSGVGNVETVTRARELIRPVCIPGIVGARVRKTLVMHYRVHPGDLLAVHTDGISARINLESYQCRDAKFIANDLLSHHSKLHDDATCLVLVL